MARLKLPPDSPSAPSAAASTPPASAQTIPFGTTVVCHATEGCREKLGAVAHSAGITSYYRCAKCGARNDFVADWRGVRWVSPERLAEILSL